ncbi:MAG: translation initiation factor IF-3 [Syntrophobacterales bacterium CG_4_8_14_3_um_filter_58_8]|nr:MAG: translation initiation factor IF-3 [Syntrophaceae bacterium CG2_30_58_14]PIV00104.1 MAG: translation initiation factor IF-3 [Syntrophobacterales bacterium CG03_land_8_20_14_0_80_58_14]PJC72484.1 MAG: translation initiation factor IF-3 [Syntrophobacterales bacterium CG_4_8_14_3_um_filter_58_8]
MAKDLKINREIRAVSVRVIDMEGKQLGVISLTDALAEAVKAGLDLVEVSPTAAPPVCRIMDYGKFRYQQSKKVQVSKKSQTVIQVKEIRLRPKTEEHDLEVKIKHVQKFLEQHNKVKISMMFRGREIAYTDIGRKIMEDIKNTLADGCVIDQQPKLEGRNMIMIVSPKK